MISALIYKGRLFTAQTHCQAYAKIKAELGREIHDKELRMIESGFATAEGVFIKEEG